MWTTKIGQKKYLKKKLGQNIIPGKKNWQKKIKINLDKKNSKKKILNKKTLTKKNSLKNNSRQKKIYKKKTYLQNDEKNS